MAAPRMHLREHGHINSGPLGLDGGPQAGQAPADDDHIVMDHACATLP